MAEVCTSGSRLDGLGGGGGGGGGGWKGEGLAVGGAVPGRMREGGTPPTQLGGIG